MSDKKTELKNAENAIADFNNIILELEGLVNAKKSEISKREKQCELKIENLEKRLQELKESSESVMDNIDNIINKLSKMLENNGSDNHNN